jgi:hypothetical protein
MLTIGSFLERRTDPMDGSRVIAWAIVLLLVAFGIAALGGPQALVAHIARLAVESPTVGSLLSTLVTEVKMFAWDLFPFAVLFILLWSKVR